MRLLLNQLSETKTTESKSALYKVTHGSTDCRDEMDLTMQGTIDTNLYCPGSKYLQSNMFHKDWCPISQPGIHGDFPH